MTSKEKNDRTRFTHQQKTQEFFQLFFSKSEFGVWLAQFDKPLPIKLPLEHQELHLKKHAYLADCNRAFAWMYGFNDPQEMIGARFPQLLDTAHATNLLHLHAFLSGGYKIENTESIELSKHGHRKYFLNDAIGVVEHQHLVRVWGSQIDCTQDREHKEILKKLTRLQLHVLKETVEGKTMKEIASDLEISIKTVEAKRSQIKSILGVHTSAEMISCAIHNGINFIEYKK